MAGWTPKSISAFPSDSSHLSWRVFVRVPPGVRHGYQNVSGSPVEMLVSFTPGGFEELFLKYRSDQLEVTGEGFVSDATRYHDSEFGLPYP